MSETPEGPPPQEPPPDDERGGVRLPPQDVEAEQAVLGAMIQSAAAIEEAITAVTGAEFYRPVHETLFDAIVGMYARGEKVDAITLKDELARLGVLTKIGGPPYLITLAQAVPIVSNVGYYAAIVSNKALLRGLVDVGTRIAQQAYADGASGETVHQRAQAEVEAVQVLRSKDELHVVGSLMERAISDIEETAANPEGVRGMPTGFYDLDELTGGMHGGQMIIVAARPAMGKSTLALDLCRSVAIREGQTAAFFSLEMGRRELVERVLSAEARVSLTKIRDGSLAEDDWLRIGRHYDSIAAAPLFIDDSPNLTMLDIRAKARRLHSRHGLRLVVIDYLQLMSSGRRVENRQLEVSEFSRQIKLLAKELDIPVIALSQLNRGVENRQNKRPLLSDLRESGSLEQDADVVMLLHRDDAYEKDSPRPGEADVIVAKHRNGPTRDITLAFQGHYSRFASLTV